MTSNYTYTTLPPLSHGAINESMWIFVCTRFWTYIQVLDLVVRWF